MKDKRNFLQKLKEINSAWLIVCAFFGGGGAVPLAIYAEDIAHYIVKDSVQRQIDTTVASVKKELDQQRHNDLVYVTELLLAIDGVPEKAEELKKKKRASRALIEAMENGH